MKKVGTIPVSTVATVVALSARLSQVNIIRSKHTRYAKVRKEESTQGYTSVSKTKYIYIFGLFFTFRINVKTFVGPQLQI